MTIDKLDASTENGQYWKRRSLRFNVGSRMMQLSKGQFRQTFVLTASICIQPSARSKDLQRRCGNFLVVNKCLTEIGLIHICKEFFELKTKHIFFYPNLCISALIWLGCSRTSSLHVLSSNHRLYDTHASLICNQRTQNGQIEFFHVFLMSSPPGKQVKSSWTLVGSM